MNNGWMGEVREREEEVSGEGPYHADRQAASWWSCLSTKRQPEVIGHLCICSAL